MQKILILKGLPASGKSTFAKEMMEKEPNKWVRTNKDDLRALIHGGKWSKQNEAFILNIRNSIISNALSEKKSVIVDDTNFAPSHEQEIKRIANLYDNVEVEVKFFDVSIEECIARDAKRANPVGVSVIYEMYTRYIRPSKEYRPSSFLYLHNEEKPQALICDLDGTATFNLGDRGFFDWDKVDLDTPNVELAKLLRVLDSKFTIIYVSGRDAICREKTEQWLRHHDFPNPFGKLYMRPIGDMRGDEIVKKEIYDNNIKDNYDIWGVFDDRPKVVRMWKSLGLRVYNCGDGVEF